MAFPDALRLELIKTLLAGLLLLLTWAIGQRVIMFWDLQKKRRELDLNAEVEFQTLYGEFKDVGRLWRIFKTKVEGSFEVPPQTRWTLLARATSAESRVEALVMKLAMERVLSPTEQEHLGLFRQAYQQMREAIRDDVPVKLSFSDTEYHFFNDLVSKVARVIRTAPTSDSALSDRYHFEILTGIVRIREDDYQRKLNQFRITAGISTITRGG